MPLKETMSANLKASLQFDSVAADKTEKELELGHMAGPFDLPPYHNLQVSSLGVVSRKEQGKF